MKVFISWSGDRSRRVADLLNTWLSGVIQRLEIFQSTEMQRGSAWFSEISNALLDVSDGIVCLTRENLNSPWILFESGAIAKGNNLNRVYTFLVDLTPSDISDPLAQFNHTLPTEESVKNLVTTLNVRLGEKALPEKTLNLVFETNWPNFKQSFDDIMADTNIPELPIKQSKEYLQDILETVRRIEQDVANQGHIVVDSRNVVRYDRSGTRTTLLTPLPTWSDNAPVYKKAARDSGASSKTDK